jgi:2-octaprenyl-6-methoxyphenol hydroxylase
MAHAKATEVAIVGAGPAGLATALALAALGGEAIVLAPAFDAARSGADTRTTALLASSLALLDNLAVWGLCSEQAAALAAIRIVDDRGGLLRAPEVLFRASELGLADFGANIANPHLNAALNAAVEASPKIHRMATAAVARITPGKSAVRLDLADGASLEVKLVVAADGRHSLGRTSAGIGVRTWDYPQIAVATSFGHARAHEGTTTELHRPSGPLTTVPLPGNASSLVWVEEPSEAQRILALDDQHFVDLLEQRLQGLLGAIRGPTARVAFPLSGLSAETMGRNRIALVGEAAHVIPPIGAQGLNLGLRDACVLAEFTAEALARGEDPGGPDLLQAYSDARQADTLTRTLAVDALNRSLLLDFLPVQALRGAGLHLLANLPSLRRLLMRSGMAPTGPLPRLMQQGALP